MDRLEKKIRDSYIEETHLWHNGDCLEFAKLFPDELIQLIVTSPPYGINKEYEKNISISDTISFQEKLIKECYRVLSPQGSFCWQVGNYINPKTKETVPLDIITYDLFKKYGFQLRNRIIWHYEHGLHAKNYFSGRYQVIMWFTKGDDYTFNLDPVRVPQKYPNKKYYRGAKKGQFSCNPLGKNPGDVWKITNVKNNHPEKIKGGHPCQFPIELVDRLILSMTHENDIVFDPFGGVASSLMSAIKNNRIGFSSEIDKNYHKIGLKRIETFFEELNFNEMTYTL